MSEKNNFQLNISVNSFDGPLDVLENMIRDRKMDILNLDIAALADQYVSFINKHINEIQIEVASDYLVMATYLLELKSIKLLPTNNIDVNNSSFDEERKQLIARLIEYRKYKETLPKFFDKKTKREDFFAKDPNDISEYSTEVQVIESLPNSINPEKLHLAFINAINKFKFSQLASKSLKVKEISVDVVKSEINDFLKTNPEFTFNFFLKNLKTKSVQYAVTCFLAILELAKYRKISITQDEKNITIKRIDNPSDIDVDDTKGDK